jgi:hypothetical protein
MTSLIANIGPIAAIVTILGTLGTLLIRLRKPRLRLKKYDASIDAVVSGDRPITWATGVKSEFWVRLRLLNSAWHPMATGVQILLESSQVTNAVEEANERKNPPAETLNLSDGRALSWADLNDSSVNIYPKILQKIDLLWGQKFEGHDDFRLRLNFHDKPTEGRDKLFAGYKYAFVIAILGSNFAPIRYSIRVSTEKPVSDSSSLHIDISRLRFWQRRRLASKK